MPSAALRAWQSVDWARPINRRDSLTRGLAYWLLSVPHRGDGTRTLDLVTRRLGTRTNMALPPTSTSGPGPTTRPGWWGEERLDATNDQIDLGAVQFLNDNQPFTVTWWEKVLPGYGAYPSRFRLKIGSTSWNVLRTDSAGFQYLSFAKWVDTGAIQATGISTVASSVGLWRHFAIVGRAGPNASTLSTYTVYQDGVPFALSGSASRYGVQGVLNVIGWDGLDNGAGAAMDDICIYPQRALSTSEMVALYADSRAGHPRMLRRLRIPLARGSAAVEAAHVTLALQADDAVLALDAHTEAHASLALVADDATLAMQVAASRHLTLALTADDATLSMLTHTEAHATLTLTADDAMLAMALHLGALETHVTLALTAADAVLSMALHIPPLAASAAWLAAAAHAATLAAQTGAYAPVLLVDFPAFSRTFSTHPAQFGAEEPRIARLAEGGVGEVSRNLDELDGGARLGGSSVALVADAGFLETFASGPLLNTEVWIRLGFEGLAQSDFVRIATQVVDRYQFTHQRLEFALIDASVKDSVNLNIPIGGDLFPNAPAASRGLNVPIFLGVHTHAPVIQVSGVAATGVLSFAMTSTSTTAILLEDSASLPEASTITVGAESIGYTQRELVNIGGRTYVELSELTRAAPVSHAIGAVVTLTDLSPSYVTGFGVDTVNAVYVDGVAQDAADVSVSALLITEHPVPIIRLLVTPGADAVVTVDVNAASPLLSFSLPPPPDEAAPNLVTNGDWEAGALTGWTVAGSGPVAAVRNAAASPVGLTGSYSLELQGASGGAAKQLYGDVTTTIGERYAWSVRYYNAEPPAYWGGPDGFVRGKSQAALGVGPTGTPFAEVHQLRAVNGWVTGSGSFVATATTTRLTLLSYLTNALMLLSTFFDEVTVQAAPLPPAGSQLVNGGFEDGDLTGWTQGGTVEDAFATDGSGVGLAPFEGTYFAALQGGEDVDGTLYQEVVTVEGQQYDYTVTALNRVSTFVISTITYTDESVGLLMVGTAATPNLYATQALGGAGVWRTTSGSFVATTALTRITLSSHYETTYITASPFPTFFDAVSLAPKPATGGGGGNPTLYHNDGENPVDAILYMLALFYPQATYNAQAFATARAQLSGLRFRGLLTNPGDSGTLLQRMGAQCKSLVTRDPMGEYAITVLDSARPTAAAFTPANIVIGSFERASVPVDAIYTSFYVYFDTFVGGSTSPGDYAGVVYCTPTATTAPDGSALVALCLEARTFYGRDHRDDCYADFVRDIDTAHQLLAWRVGRYAVRQDALRWRAWLDAVPLQLGQVVSLAHPVLANALAVVPTELVGWHYQPGSQHVDLTTRTLGPSLDVGLVAPAAPVAYPDVATTALNTPVVLEVLANDVPALGAVLNALSVDLDPATGGRQTSWTDTGKAVFVVGTDGRVTCTPVTDYAGAAVASYTVADQFGLISNAAAITVQVLPAPAHLTLALVAADATLVMALHVEGGEEPPAEGLSGIWITDAENRVQQFTVAGEFIQLFGAAGTGNGQFAQPQGIAVAADGSLWVVDGNNNRVQHFDADGAYLGQFGSFGNGNGQLNTPSDVFIAADDSLWIGDGLNSRFQHFSSDGTYLGQFGEHGAGAERFQLPDSLAVAADGTLWTTDVHGYRFYHFEGDGTFLAEVFYPGVIVDSELHQHYGLAIAADDSLWLVGSDDHCLNHFDSAGEFIETIGGPGTGNGQFNTPVDIVIDPATGDLWVTDTGNNRVQHFDSAGAFLSQFGTPGTAPGELSSPHSIALSEAAAFLGYWDLFYDVAVVDFTSDIVEEVIPGPPGAAFDLPTLTLDRLVFPQLALTLTVGEDGIITGDRTDTLYGGPYFTTFRVLDTLGNAWRGTFSITFIAG